MFNNISHRSTLPPGCLRGTLVVTKILGCIFISSEIVSYSDGFGRKFEVME